MPLKDLLEAIASQGLSIDHASQATGLGYSSVANYARQWSIKFEGSLVRASVVLLTGLPFEEAVRVKCDAGCTRRQAAELLGVDYMYFLQVIEPFDPFPSLDVAGQHLRDTGKTVVQGAREAAALGMCQEEAARFLGYASSPGLKHALRARGVTVEFPPKARVKKPFREGRGVGRIKSKTTGAHPWRKWRGPKENERMGSGQA
jgi:hypothetical protein